MSPMSAQGIPGVVHTEECRTRMGRENERGSRGRIQEEVQRRNKFIRKHSQRHHGMIQYQEGDASHLTVEQLRAANSKAVKGM